MEILYWYGLFALTTAICAVYELVIPVMYMEKTLNGKVDNIVLYYVIFLCIFMLTAPLVFLACVIPSIGETFKTALHNSLFSKE